MRKFASLLLVATLPVVSVSSIFAQDDLSIDDISLDSSAVTTSDTASVNAEDTTLNAPSNTTAVTAKSVNLGEYKEVSCSTDVVFSQNSCNQCFVGATAKVGEKKTDLFDNWKNPTSDSTFIIVKDEQKIPQMISFGSNWVPASSDESKMWKNSPVIEWVPNSENGKQEFALLPNQEIRFIETDLGAGYTLESTTKKHGEVIGLLKFPLTYYTQSLTNATRSATADTHYECVKVTLDNPGVPPTTPEKPVVPKTDVQTGPAETLVLIIAAFFIAFGLMISLRKRS